MDHYSILDHSSPAPTVGTELSSSSPSRSAPQSVSSGIAAANALAPKPSETAPRFPGEDAGRSLAEMAHRDLDAALQLLAERAQYITGASGAAIALRRGVRRDMLCRASSGSNAPELGALLSMEYGLSGECVRTRQLLRCDDAARDPRVNRDVCRDLGIASVVVMPIVDDAQVLGVFELLSGKPRAFDERDLSALLRLSEMVETAVKYAVSNHIADQEIAVPETQLRTDVTAAEVPQLQSRPLASESIQLPAPPPEEVLPAKPEDVPPVPRKPLFWSAAMRAQGGGPANESKQIESESTEPIVVPPVLRKLQKCQACGFPVSQGRAFCVECEERQWRGQRLAQPAIRPEKDQPSPLIEVKPDVPRTPVVPSAASQTPAVETSSGKVAISTPASDSKTPPTTEPPSARSSSDQEPIAPQASSATLPSSDVASHAADPANSGPLFSSALQPESWLASNKYILGALLIVAIVVGAIAWLH